MCSSQILVVSEIPSFVNKLYMASHNKCYTPINLYDIGANMFLVLSDLEEM
jgi:hypothetical protein